LVTRNIAARVSAFTASIDDQRPRPTGWSYSFRESASVGEVIAPPVIEIRRRKLPKPGEGGCLLLSAGIREGGAVLGEKVRDSLSAMFTNDAATFGDLPSHTVPIRLAPSLWRHKMLPVFFLAARSGARDERDARIIKSSVASRSRDYIERVLQR
jgi:hypothetical protein